MECFNSAEAEGWFRSQRVFRSRYQMVRFNSAEAEGWFRRYAIYDGIAKI